MAMACGSTIRQSVYVKLSGLNFQVPPSSSPSSLIPVHKTNTRPYLLRNRFHLTVVPKASASVNPTDDDGVSLGTMKLPINTDLQRFDSLLFQWANSLAQGANLPLPMPLKVDKIAGGARLGFISIEDGGKTQVLVYIDCLVFPATENSAPLFRAIRNGPLKDKVLPGEPRIMRSLMEALQKSVQIARL